MTTSNPAHELPSRDLAARDLQDLLAGEFGREEIQLDDHAETAIEACLVPLLKALNWPGDSRRLFEVKPHLEPVADVGTFRAVLSRLGFRTKLIDLAPEQITPEFMPCLIERGDGLAVVRARRADGSLEIFCGTTRGDAVLEPRALHGRRMTVYLVTAADHEGERQDRTSWFWGSLWRFRQPIGAVVLLTFATNMLALATPIFVANVYNHVVTAHSLETLAFFLAAIILAISFEMHLRHIKATLVAYIGARFHAALANAAFERVLSLPIAMVEQVSVATQVARFRQFEGVRTFFTGHLVNTMLDLPFTLVFFAALAWIDPVFVLAPIGLVVVYVLLGIATIPVTRRNLAATGQIVTRGQSFLIETLTRADTVHQLGAETVWAERYRTLSREAVLQKFRAQSFDSALQTVAASLSTLAGVATLGAGAVLVMKNELSVGGLIAVMMVIWRLLTPIQTAFMGLNNLSQFGSTIRQINALMRIAPERDPALRPLSRRRFGGAVTLDGIAYRYPGRVEPALKGVALQIPAGQIIAITGPAGAGKTTLLKMLLGLYQPAGGTVYLDGLNLQQIDPSEIRTATGFVPQDPLFFFGTVRQNLALARPEATDAEMLRALADAGFDELEAHFPEGLETKILGGLRIGFSEGVQMRLALARAYVRRPTLLLLDDPGANLDHAGDEALARKLAALRGRTTVILVTSRPSHMRACDRIIRLERGVVTADGPPDAVLPKLYPQQKQDVHQRTA